jgi:hypothetical protein
MLANRIKEFLKKTAGCIFATGCFLIIISGFFALLVVTRVYLVT